MHRQIALAAGLALAFSQSVRLTISKKILVLFGRTGALIAQLCGGVQRPVRVCKMGTGEADQIRASGCDDAIHMVGLVNVAYGDGRDAPVVTDDVRQRSLKHASGLRLSGVTRLSGGNIDDVCPGFDKCLGNRGGFALGDT